MGKTYDIEGQETRIHEEKGYNLISSAPSSTQEVALYDGNDVYVGVVPPGGEKSHTYQHWIKMQGTSSDGLAHIHVS